MEWIETTGVSVDEAKERALDRLGVAEDDLEYQVLAEPTSALFGLRRTDARLQQGAAVGIPDAGGTGNTRTS